LCIDVEKERAEDYQGINSIIRSNEGCILRSYSDGWDAGISLARFLWRYCQVRPHSSLGG
jgi:transposase InsO family protein